MIRRVAIGWFCGLLAGAAVLGVGGRIVMRAIGLIAERAPEFSPGGTIEVIAFAAIIGSLAGAAFAAIKEYLPGAAPLRGMLFGLLLFLAVSLIRPPSVERSAAAFEDFLPPVILMFGAVFLLYGMALALAEDAAGGRFKFPKSN